MLRGTLGQQQLHGSLHLIHCIVGHTPALAHHTFSSTSTGESNTHLCETDFRTGGVEDADSQSQQPAQLPNRASVLTSGRMS